MAWWPVCFRERNCTHVVQFDCLTCFNLQLEVLRLVSTIFYSHDVNLLRDWGLYRHRHAPSDMIWRWFVNFVVLAVKRGFVKNDHQVCFSANVGSSTENSVVSTLCWRKEQEEKDASWWQNSTKFSCNCAHEHNLWHTWGVGKNRSHFLYTTHNACWSHTPRLFVETQHKPCSVLVWFFMLQLRHETNDSTATQRLNHFPANFWLRSSLPFQKQYDTVSTMAHCFILSRCFVCSGQWRLWNKHSTPQLNEMSEACMGHVWIQSTAKPGRASEYLWTFRQRTQILCRLIIKSKIVLDRAERTTGHGLCGGASPQCNQPKSYAISDAEAFVTIEQNVLKSSTERKIVRNHALKREYAGWWLWFVTCSRLHFISSWCNFAFLRIRAWPCNCNLWTCARK